MENVFDHNSNSSGFDAFIGYLDPLYQPSRRDGRFDDILREVPSPYVEIMEEPKPAIKFRYRWESGQLRAAPLHGVHNTAQNHTWPTIRIHNYVGPVLVIVSCVTAEEPFRNHPHSLVFRNDDDDGGVVKLKMNIRINKDITCNRLKMQCIKGTEFRDSMEKRKRWQFICTETNQKFKADPFRNAKRTWNMSIDGFDHNLGSINLNSVRLAFQVYVWKNAVEFPWEELEPVVSQPISKTLSSNQSPGVCSGVLDIKLISQNSGVAAGGTDIIVVLLEKVNLESLEVVFYERQDMRVVWFAPAVIEIKHQGIVLKIRSPPYSGQSDKQEIVVWIHVVNRSNNTFSSSQNFTYIRDFMHFASDINPVNPEGRSSRLPRHAPNNDTNVSKSSKDTETDTNDTKDILGDSMAKLSIKS